MKNEKLNTAEKHLQTFSLCWIPPDNTRLMSAFCFTDEPQCCSVQLPSAPHGWEQFQPLPARAGISPPKTRGLFGSRRFCRMSFRSRTTQYRNLRVSDTTEAQLGKISPVSAVLTNTILLKTTGHLVLGVFTLKRYQGTFCCCCYVCTTERSRRTSHLHTAEQVFFSCSSFFGLHKIMQGDLCSWKNMGKI